MTINMGRGNFIVDTTSVIRMYIEQVSKHLPKCASIVAWKHDGQISDITLTVEHSSIPEGATVRNPMLGTGFIVETAADKQPHFIVDTAGEVVAINTGDIGDISTTFVATEAQADG